MKLSNYKLGIVQGRLTQSKILQKFPKDPYKEFFIANELGLNFIEFITERQINKNNPIWKDHLIKKYIGLAKKNKILIYSACDDYVINCGLNKRYLIYLKKLIPRLSKLRIKKFIIPLEGRAELKQNSIEEQINILKKISSICKIYKINYFIIESNMNFEMFNYIKKKINKKNLYFLYDLGNRSIRHKDVYSDVLKFGKYIKHIHLKDKNQYGENVMIGKGKVNFLQAFKAIKIIYSKNISFAFENNRGKNAIESAKKNIFFFKKLFKY